MNTNEFAQTLLTWIKTLLLWIGIPHPILNKLDEIIFLVFIIIIAFAIGTAMHYITLYFTRRILKYKQIGEDFMVKIILGIEVWPALCMRPTLMRPTVRPAPSKTIGKA